MPENIDRLMEAIAGTESLDRLRAGSHKDILGTPVVDLDWATRVLADAEGTAVGLGARLALAMSGLPDEKVAEVKKQIDGELLTTAIIIKASEDKQ